MEMIAERKNKTIYRDNDKVIKLFVKDHPKSEILNEALNQARVNENSNINIPELLEVKKIDDRWAIVSEYIEGNTISNLMKEDPSNLDEYLELFVNIQLIILNNSVPMLNRIKDKFTKKITETNLLDKNVKYDLLSKLHSVNNGDNLCHGDLIPSNVIVKNDGTIYVIDWAHVTQGNKEADAARTYMLFILQNNKVAAEKYIKLFSEKSGISISKIQYWLPIVAASQMTKNIPEEKEILSKWVNVVDYE